MKHTPGPWQVQETGIYTADEHEVWIASCGNGQAERKQINKANARLIAAAPNLLQALKQMLDAFYHDPLGGGQDAAVEAALDAIAKAEGEK